MRKTQTDDGERFISIIGATQIGSELTKGGWAGLALFMVLLNVFVGLFNLVPLLPLVSVAAFRSAKPILDWIEAERRTLRDIELQALEVLAEVEIDQDRPAEAERVARRLIATDALRESGYRLLMRALASGGNAAQAARVMDECRAALASAQASPSKETERVFLEILG